MSNKQKTNAFEFKLNTTSTNFKTTMGLFNQENPISLYLSISSWVEHTGDFKEYQNNVLELKNKIRLKIKKLIKDDNDIFDTNFIFDFKIKKALRHEDKIVFSCIDITLKQKNLLIVSDLESVMADFSDKLLYMLENQPNFEFKQKVKVI